MYDVDSIEMRMSDFGDNAPQAPTLPNDGCKCGANSPKNRPDGAAYAPPKYRTPIATLVYNMPIIPTSENGASRAKFFTKHSGNNTEPVKPTNAWERVAATPAAANKSLLVSAKIIEYDTIPAKQSNAELVATIHAVLVPRVLSHASEYDVAPVRLHTRAIIEKV